MYIRVVVEISNRERRDYWLKDHNLVSDWMKSGLCTICVFYIIPFIVNICINLLLNTSLEKGTNQRHHCQYPSRPFALARGNYPAGAQGGEAITLW
jgi:hypothetical protein